MSKPICFATEVDLDRDAAGGVMTELKMLSFLKIFGDVEVIYLRSAKYRSKWLALAWFGLQVLKSSFEPYQVYFSRGLVTSLLLLFSKQFYGKRKKIVHRTVLPFVAVEVKHMGYNRFERLFRYLLFRFLDRIVLFHVDTVVVPAVEYVDDLVNIGIKRDKVHVIPLYVEDEFFKQPIKLAQNGIFKFCYVSGFHSYHNFFPLIESFQAISKRFRNVKFFLVGDGVMRSDIERRVLEKNLEDRIKFVGKIPHSSVPHFLSQMDVFVSMSRSPAISTSLLEAAATGKAIIAVRKKEDKALNRYFRGGREIYMLNSASPREIEKAFEMLYVDSRLRNTLAIGARKVARKYFSRKVALRQLCELLNRLAVLRLEMSWSQ